MEGSLSKWTNVVQGWQYRYFVLNEDSLSYYTSREKMLRGQQRGCIRLNGAAIGIDGENAALFTITVDGKVFHLQGKDVKERDMWVKELERIIHLKSGYYKPRPGDQVVDLNNRVNLAERQLQDLLEIVKKLETVNTHSEKVEEKRKRYLNEVLLTTRRLQNTVEHSTIILRQVQQKFPAPSAGRSGEDGAAADTKTHTTAGSEEPPVLPPQITYSSSEEDEFFDAASGVFQHHGHGGTDSDLTDCGCVEDCPSDSTDAEPEQQRASDGSFPTQEPARSTHASRRHRRHHKRQHHRGGSGRHARAKNGGGEGGAEPSNGGSGHVSVARPRTVPSPIQGHAMRGEAAKKHSSTSSVGTPAGGALEEPDWGDADEDFDAIYENTAESELGNVQQQHGSVLMHLLSQVSVGMDLTKVTLPTFILERRSLLEMYADFFAHPEDFVRGSEVTSPGDRFVSIVRYYLNAFYPARKSGVAKKPYNPILGETFRCRWSIPGGAPSGKRTQSGPFPGSDTNQVTFVAEQVSHHPPISAFYAEHPEKRISLTAHIWTKSSFLGLSIGVQNIGNAVVTLHEHDEQYVVTFPSGYGRSIMGTPWVELGGKVSPPPALPTPRQVEVRCRKTGYHAEIDFLTKPIFGGKAHRIAGKLFKQGMKQPFMTLRGEWNGCIYAKHQTGDEFLFTDVRAKPDVRKECEPVARQGDRESRRLWRHVTSALFHERITVASNAKRWIEQRQRDEAKQRLERGAEHRQLHFQKQGEDWLYQHDLSRRAVP